MANEMGYTGDRMFSISLGQGQGPFAENAIKEAIEKGTWVLLQNCHLLVSWLPTLQKLVEEIDPANTNPDFRLWLTSMPSPHFPISVLQNGVKMTNEPPKGIKANVAETYRTLSEEWFEDCSKPDRLKKMFYSLAMFHAVCLERRRFGPMGWNIRYQWTVGDRDISKTQLKIYLDLYDDIPTKALRYLFGQLNYGGRVTDEWDTRAVTYILTDYINGDLVEPGYRFDLQGKYTIPLDGTDIDGYREWITQMPEEDSSEVFGLHDNVNISAAISDSNELFATLLAVQPRTSGGGGGGSRDDIVGALAKDIESKIPDNFDVEDAEEKYPVQYENSMNTVLVQELIRFNKLIGVVRKSLNDVQRAIRGEVVMSAELEAMANSMYNGKVPAMWHAVAYPSLKPLSSWVIDLLQRLEMYSTWIEKGAPCNYWISGFFFTQSFLTGTLQNYARKYKIAIDELAYDFEVMPYITPEHGEPPEDGCYIWGLFLDGARFKDGFLTEPMKRQLNSIMPTVWLKPTREQDIPTDRSEYECPLYKTSERFGVLSTTGRSTNFVIGIKLPSREEAKHWVKRGVALLTQKELA
jgi:dynein heavy chain